MADLAVLVRQLQAQIDELQTARVGTLVWRVTDEQADDELFANGQVVTADFPILRAQLVALGSPHGTSGGNPKLPDLRGKFATGAGGAYALGASGGADSVTLTTPQIPAHNHGVTDPGHRHTVTDNISGTAQNFLTTGAFAPWSAGAGGGSLGIAPTAGNDPAGTGISIQNAGGGNSHENRPPYVALWPFVKAA